MNAVGLRYANEMRWLYQTAMLLFLGTIGLGMTRGIGLGGSILVAYTLRLRAPVADAVR
jgi:hypothetical protein